MARGEWNRAGALTAQAGSVLRRAGIEDSRVTPLLCAARARVALHRRDVPAELRVIPLLATHLTSAEIAAELFVSVHTVKSQQASLYRKLGTSSRSQAISRARQLGLLEG
jgi:LuxR family transcriptional regulator, maltose regulon positive regulatory protein